MRNSTFGRSILVVAGGVLIAIGGAALVVPHAFHATNGIELGGTASLLSEVRAAGGGLLAIGVLVTLGAFVARLAVTSAGVGALVYLSYGLARLLSLALDGPPADGLVVATILELLFGMACVLALVRPRGEGAPVRPR